jgi:hypothetical protein
MAMRLRRQASNILRNGAFVMGFTVRCEEEKAVAQHGGRKLRLAHRLAAAPRNAC